MVENLDERLGQSKGAWDYINYAEGQRVMGRIIPSNEGTVAIAYRVETIDGVRIGDGQVGWAEISQQIRLAPEDEREVSRTDKAIARAIAEDIKARAF